MVISLVSVDDVDQREVEVTDGFVELRWGGVHWRRHYFRGIERTSRDYVTAWAYVPDERRVVLLHEGEEIFDATFASIDDFKRVVDAVKGVYDAARQSERGLDVH